MSAPDGKHVQNATPDWVLAQVKTYPVSTEVMGTNPMGETAVSQFPDFRDPKFLQLTSALVRDLAQRYDGNPTIAQVRIGTGLLGEENPIVGGVPGYTTMPNFQEPQWLAFCLETVHQYQSAFHKSELEFDISRLGFTRALGTGTDQVFADVFAELVASRLFIAYNGLEAHDDDLLTGCPEPGRRDRRGSPISFGLPTQRRANRPRGYWASCKSAHGHRGPAKCCQNPARCLDLSTGKARILR